MAQPAAAQQQQRRRVAAGSAAVGAAGVAPAAAGGAGAAAGVAGVGGVGVVTAGVVAALIQFLSAIREQHRAWLTAELGQYSTQPDDIAAVIAQEMQLEDAFARNSADRVASALPQALAIADRQQRESRVRQILADEERFAAQRAEAMVARAIAALGRLQLRRDSPLGAFWQLGLAHKHTEGCVVGETLVAGPKARSGVRREYAGELVEVVIAAGDVLRVTPNHPILTPLGWRRACDLREGDEVFRDGGRIKRDGWPVEDPHDVRPIKEVVEAIEQSPTALRVAHRIQRFDFHGDGTEGKVGVISADRGLLHRNGVEVDQGISQTLLVRGDPVFDAGATTRSPLGSVGAVTASAERCRSGLARFAPGGVLLGRHRRNRELHGVGAGAADRDARLEQHALERAARHAELVGQALEGMAGVVAIDHVRQVRHFDWAGHVYNLSTDGGWYTASSLILQNCLHMAGKFWPWPVLDRVHPPRHYGCTSTLHGYGDAIMAGWMTPSDVPDARDAIARAAGVMMEGEAEGLLRELDVREWLLEQGVDTSVIPFAGVSEAFDPGEARDFRGRWRRVKDAAAALKGGRPASIEPRDAQRLVDALNDGSRSSLHLLEVKGHPNLFRAHAREMGRGEMPQIPKEHLRGFMDFLRSRRVMASVERVPPSSLRATQNQVNGGAVAALARGWDPQRGGTMLVSRDLDVLDGHHRWGAMALYEMTHPGYKVDVLRFSAPTNRMLRLMHEYNDLVGVERRRFGHGSVPLPGRGAA